MIFQKPISQDDYNKIMNLLDNGFKNANNVGATTQYSGRTLNFDRESRSLTIDFWEEPSNHFARSEFLGHIKYAERMEGAFTYNK